MFSNVMNNVIKDCKPCVQVVQHHQDYPLLLPYLHFPVIHQTIFEQTNHSEKWPILTYGSLNKSYFYQSSSVAFRTIISFSPRIPIFTLSIKINDHYWQCPWITSEQGSKYLLPQFISRVSQREIYCISFSVLGRNILYIAKAHY